MEPYGHECIIDVHECTVQFTRASIEKFCIELCELIDMEREDLFFWDYDGDPEGYAAAPPHLKGISAVQFIKTSNITLHTLDELRRLYLNVFSCKLFDAAEVRRFVQQWTGGTIVGFMEVARL